MLTFSRILVESFQVSIEVVYIRCEEIRRHVDTKTSQITRCLVLDVVQLQTLVLTIRRVLMG